MNFHFPFVILLVSLLGGNLQANAEPVTGQIYRTRYPTHTASEKIISEEGRGLANLYGTRNMRAVLNGVYYRGGANNLYFNPPRANMNPLPTVGIENLCKEGFGTAVYLYSTNYDGAPHSLQCKTFDGATNTIQYLQISPLKYRRDELKTLFTLIWNHVRNPALGAIYDHCWNGWHASGYVAASTLQQFCGFSATEAINYWNLNTDGNSGKEYNDLRAKIRAFEPFPEMSLTAEEKFILCPAPGNLRFPQ